MKDAKGKTIPAWARYIKDVTTLVESKAAGQIVPFALYCPDEATVTFVPVDNVIDGVDIPITVTLGAGYHPIAIKTLTSSSITVLALFAWNYEA